MVKAEERFDNIAFSTELVEGMASSLHTVYVCPQCEEKIAFQKRNFECSLSKTHRSNLTIEVASCFDAFAQENLKRDSPFLDWICPGCGTAARVYVEFWAGGRHGDSGINLLTVIEAMPKKTPWRVVHI
jgi:rubredoxin